MSQRRFYIISLCFLSVTAAILLRGNGDTPQAPGAAGASEKVPAAPVPKDATPVAEEVVLTLDGEEGPASLTVRLKEGGKPPAAPWRPSWPALKEPFKAVPDKKNEYRAAVDVDLAMVRRWDNPATNGMIYWQSRFEEPKPYTLVPVPKPPVFPMKLKYNTSQRVRQMPLPYAIDWGKSLFITMTDVVNNPQRTWEPSKPTEGTRDGAWTFHHLMSAIANERVTGVAPGDMVKDLLLSFTKNEYPEGPNGAMAPARNATLVNEVLSLWPKLAGTNTLDTSQSPFRLLAIVNRIDLRLSTAWGDIDNHRAELRFVFCYVQQPGQTEAGMYRDFLVIVEFGVPLPDFTAVRNYALKWTNLSRPGLSTPDLCAELGCLTEDIVHASAAPDRPNGSNLNHVRTEDLYFANPSQQQGWELREFLLHPGSHLLKTNPLNMTPDFGWSAPGPDFVYNVKTMREWIQANAPAIQSGVYELPQELKVTTPTGTAAKKLRGASARDGDQNWFALPNTQACSAEARLGFIRNTCNGCHSTGHWTPENEATWTFTFLQQVAGRMPGDASKLSDFLTKDEQPRRIEVLRSIVESDPILPIQEFFQRQITGAE